MPITFLYKNRISDAVSITENSSRLYYGTAFLYDNDLNSVYRGTSGNGTTTILFTFGSAVYMDSVACISNLTSSGTMVLRAGTLSSVGNFNTGIPLDGLGTSHKFFNATYPYEGSERDLYVGPYQSGVSASYVRIVHKPKINYFGTKHVSIGCWIKQNEPTSARIGFGINGGVAYPQLNNIINGTSDITTLGTWQWVSYTVAKTGTQAYWVGLDALEQNSGVHFDGFKSVIGASISPSARGEGTALIQNGDFNFWTNGTVVGTVAPDNWLVYQWTHASNPQVTVGGTGFIRNDLTDIYGYKFWRLDLFGVTAIFKHQVNEVFLGKRLSIAEMPSYPYSNSTEEDTTELISERGQKYIYTNYQRENFTFNFEGINATTESGLFNMYKYCRKNTQPFWMSLDPEAKPNDIKYVRFKNNAFLSDEITKNVFDLTLELEEEI